MDLSLNLESTNESLSSSLKISYSDITEKYEIRWTRMLGTGVNGAVVICIDKLTSEKFALKLLDENDKSNLELSLHWECHESPHIVAIRDLFQCHVAPPCHLQKLPGVYICVVMELMSGGDLYEHISNNDKLNERQASYITKQIAIGLKDIHQKGIAHRDIKPENVLFQAPFKKDLHQNTIKITDFGFAKEEEKGLTSPVYTLYYVSPDLINASNLKSEDNTYDKRCDLWSVGVIVFIMLMGYPPFYPETGKPPKMNKKLCDAILRGNLMIHKMDEWNSISKLGQEVVKGLLTVDPDQRMSLDALLAHPWLN